MGLCKCPKRRVTTQFCFEHRVNVCEYCMVTNHPRCIVQSYLQWLQDSDYFPICELCTKPLAGDECIRLTCYHVFHWSCAEQHYRSLGRSTAPAGYRCVSCSVPVFPAPNLVSPVADVLRVRLAGVNWARAGLGMPLLSEDQDQKAALESRGSSSPVDAGFLAEGVGPRAAPLGASDDEAGPTPNGSAHNAHSIVQMQEDSIGMYDSTSVKRSEGNQAPRRVFQDMDQSHSASNFDHDDNKYKGKSTFAWIWRWWKNTQSRTRRSGGHLYKRYWLLAAVLIVIVVLVLLSLAGRSPLEDDDPFAALAHNPQQMVAHKN